MPPAGFFHLGEIGIFAFPWPPAGFATCNGQLLPIAQNKDLFALLGTTFGGDGIRTFGLPNLQSRTPIGLGQGQGLTPRSQGDAVGEESHTLTTNESGAHSHLLSAEPGKGTDYQPSTSVIVANSQLFDESGKISDMPIYVDPTWVDPKKQSTMQLKAMHADSIQPIGPSAPHTNMMPFLTLSFCISLTGPIPSRN
jgi:microcystin-dependent protein